MPLTNHLFYGDNLDVMRGHVADESVDLIYLDPPFNSNASYNILFRSPDGAAEAEAQVKAFEDSWCWKNAGADAYHQVMRSGRTTVYDMLTAMQSALGTSSMMAYLAMMAIRLIEMHRVLTPRGSLYLHCDPTAGHYLKLLLDGIFGPEQFRNDITWKRTTAHNDSMRYGRNTDTLLFYAKGATPTWNVQFAAYTDDHESRFRNTDPDGRRWMDDNLSAKGLSGGGYHYEYRGVRSYWRMPLETMQRLDREGRLYFTRTGGIRLKRYRDEARGSPMQALWTDISALNSQARERIGYPTQKPLALLERIIAASSNPGDLILDPFCGSGTTIHAAHKLGRRWAGIDVTHLAIGMVEKRMNTEFPGVTIHVEGTPRDRASAEDLARRDPYQFQWWAVAMIDATPFAGRRKGPDGGVDGIIYFRPERSRTAKALVSVKSGEHVGVKAVRELHSVMERERAPIGVIVSRTAPSAPMLREAASVGRFHSEAMGRSYARLQILTVDELFAGKRPDIPLVDPFAAFRTAAREVAGEQARLL